MRLMTSQRLLPATCIAVYDRAFCFAICLRAVTRWLSDDSLLRLKDTRTWTRCLRACFFVISVQVCGT